VPACYTTHHLVLPFHPLLTPPHRIFTCVCHLTDTRNLGLADATCDKNIAFVGSQAAATNGLVQVIDTVMFPPGACAHTRTRALVSGVLAVGGGISCG
jgi:hypothetical protein